MAVTHTGVFVVREYPRSVNPRYEEFSYHYFNAAGDEVGMQHASFPDHCMVFLEPRKWDPDLKRNLSIKEGVIGI